jgi:hypothetical protein
VQLPRSGTEASGSSVTMERLVASSSGASQLPRSKVQRRVPHSCLVKSAPMYRRLPSLVPREAPSSSRRKSRVILALFFVFSQVMNNVNGASRVSSFE